MRLAHLARWATALALALAALPASRAAATTEVASPAPLVYAPVPLAAPEAPAATRNYPGGAPCNTTLQACISGSGDGDTIIIAANTYVTSSLSITRAVSLVGGGANPAAVKLRPVGGRMFTISAPGLSASQVYSNFTIENAVSASGSGGAIRINAGSGAPLFHSLVISNNTVTFAGGGGGGVRVIATVPVTMINVTVFSNTATGGGGGVSTDGPLTLINSRIMSNTSPSRGGGLDVGGTLFISNSVVLTNTAAISGGGIYAGAAVTIENGAVNVNKAQFGGGLFAVSANTVTISGAVTFQGNQATGVGAPGGGGILAYGNVNLAGGLSLAGRTLFKNNSAFVGGGGISALGSVYFTRGFPQDVYIEFDGNSAQVSDGGGIRAFGEVRWLQSSVLLRMTNNVAYNGGAIWAGNDVDLFFDSLNAFATLIGNTATLGNGGAIYGVGNVILRGGNGMSGNTAVAHGGIVYADGQVSTVLAKTSATGAPNQAGINGGCVYGANGVTLNNGSLMRCSAPDGNGGAAFSGSWLRTFNSAQVISGSARTGAGLYATTFLTVEDNTLLASNAASIAGGGAFAGLDALVRSSTLQNNTAITRGGGLVVSATVQITGTLLERNRTTGNSSVGGAVFAPRATYVTNTTFLTNSTSTGIGSAGGGHAGGPITVTNSAFVGNSSLNGGGISTTLALVQNSVFTGNQSYGKSGGGIWATRATVRDSRFFGNANTGFTNSDDVGGGGMFADRADVERSYFEANSTQEEGAALYISRTGAITDSVFFQNIYGGYRGSAVFVKGQGGGTTSIQSSLFDGNIDNNTLNGGGAIESKANSLVVRSSTFVNNHGQNGGAIKATSLDVADSTFFNNVADCCGAGGALWTGSANIQSSTFISNYADCCDGGGAVYAGGIVSVQDSTFISNSVEERMDGGAILADSYLYVGNSVFRSNQVRKAASNNFGRGGAIHANYNQFAQVQVVGSEFTGNRANHGGALWCYVRCVVETSRFESNTADQPDELTATSIGTGGAIGAQGDLIVRRTRFLRNTAGVAGGAVYHDRSLPLYSDGTAIENSLFAENLARNPVLGSRGHAMLVTNTTGISNIYFNTIVSDALTAGTAVALMTGTFSVIDNIVVSHSVGIEKLNGTVFENFNLYFGNGTNLSGTIASGGSSLVAAPQFISPALDVYHLRPGSPAIDAGTDVLVSQDIDGQSRPQGAGFDIGIDEDGLPRVYVPGTMRSRSDAW